MEVKKVTKLKINIKQNEVNDLIGAIEVVYKEFSKKDSADPFKDIEALIEFKDKLVLSLNNGKL